MPEIDINLWAILRIVFRELGRSKDDLVLNLGSTDLNSFKNGILKCKAKLDQITKNQRENPTR